MLCVRCEDEMLLCVCIGVCGVLWSGVVCASCLCCAALTDNVFLRCTSNCAQHSFPFFLHHYRHVQYSLALPALHAMLAELEKRPCRGAQLLDFLATHQSGATLVNSIVQRCVACYIASQ